jgi:uncharacterized protein YndB with AHSA1/START domain
MRIVTLFVVALGLAGPVAAEVVDKSPTGFTSKTAVTIAASPARVYAMLSRVGEWWEPAHTYSGDSKNLRIEARAGACFCEDLPAGGSVEHGVVVYVEPGATIRIRSALGPLQGLGVAGSLTWALEGSGTGTTATVTYAVGGYAPGGLEALAPIVDQVIGAQLTRLKAVIERP